MKTINISLLFVGLAIAFTSCGQKEDPASKPVKKPVVEKKTVRASTVDAAVDGNPTNPFRTPADDTNLPTAEQIADGRESSIGTGSKPVSNPSAPSVAVSPPPAPVAPTTPDKPEPKPTKKEDQLDPQ
ncbi:MAG: hypothetical protein KJO79_08995 [Verrucomicrobiae bacterium]|nr:hypothetical protein [Verrucomicrobiae bacterium]NNJ87306.1 hypothetical protein [Akkermansiaceae bacterium]